MNSSDFNLWDWQRIFIGEVPTPFIIEVILRLAIVYVLLLSSMRLLGKRMASQLSRNELAALVSLASAVGIPILDPQRGVLPPLIIAIVVVAISRILSHFTAKDPRVESYTQGSLDILVKDAIIDMKAMAKTRVTRERIMAQLRSDGITNLGQVKRLYIEANGSFSLVKEETPSPGLAVIPEDDLQFLHEQPMSDCLVCGTCGNKNISGDRSTVCGNCNNSTWTKAIKST
ncbi:MAG TPA: YetF domain-containing protein [Chryseolinea sp.]|nr:YetF domain-containing protein [Chryseolinea sp.]